MMQRKLIIEVFLLPQPKLIVAQLLMMIPSALLLPSNVTCIPFLVAGRRARKIHFLALFYS
jgi:hypothetical protein